MKKTAYTTNKRQIRSTAAVVLTNHETNANGASFNIDSLDAEGLQLNWIASAKRIFSDQNLSQNVDSNKPIKPIIKKTRPSDTFLSKINKFEQLARGFPATGDAKTQLSTTSQTSMPQAGVDKRSVKSRSFGCEKELHKEHSKQMQWSAPKSRSKPGRRISKKPKNVIESAEAAKSLRNSAKPFVMDKIDFIDEDEASSNGDNSDAIIDDLDNDTNPDDTEDESAANENGGGTSCESLSGLSHINQDLKCRSAPITPTRMSPTMNMTQNNDYQYNETCLVTVTKQQKNQHNYNAASFVYNMNLYDDHKRVQLLNDKGNYELDSFDG